MHVPSICQHGRHVLISQLHQTWNPQSLTVRGHASYLAPWPKTEWCHTSNQAAILVWRHWETPWISHSWHILRSPIVAGSRTIDREGGLLPIMMNSTQAVEAQTIGVPRTHLYRPVWQPRLWTMVINLWYVAAKTWNNLPETTRMIDILESFMRQMKAVR